jgi:hypothetical protein
MDKLAIDDIVCLAFYVYILTGQNKNIGFIYLCYKGCAEGVGAFIDLLGGKIISLLPR